MILDFDYLTEMIKKAGQLILQPIDRNQIQQKGRADFVTQCDIRVQEYVKAELSSKYPEIGFIGEESGEHCYMGEMQWILDPIDGTTNYIYDYKLSAISLALKEGKEVTFGMIYNPFTGELFSASKGQGAYLNGKPIKVNTAMQLRESLVAIGTSPYYKEMAPFVFDKVTALYKQALDIRRTGSAALDLAYVACGRQDMYFEYRLKPWDYAAGMLLVAEAGGFIKGLDGEISLQEPSNILVCCSEELMLEVEEIFD